LALAIFKLTVDDGVWSPDIEKKLLAGCHLDVPLQDWTEIEAEKGQDWGLCIILHFAPEWGNWFDK
jgi:hypothetical protein